MNLTFPTLIAAAFGIFLVFSYADHEARNLSPDDFYIHHVDIDGMDCVVIKSYSQMGITCDWSARQ